MQCAVTAAQVVFDEHEGVAYNWSFFHFTFMCASLYLTMVLTNWDILRCARCEPCPPSLARSHDSGSNTIALGDTTASVWVKIVSSWVCVIMYAWSLLAPICLPDRDFN